MMTASPNRRRREMSLRQDYARIASEIGISHNPRLVRRLAEKLGATPGIKILDMGCGCGGDAFLLSVVSGASLLGVDRSAPMLEKASSEIPVVQAEVEAVPLRSAMFGGIYAVNLLQLLPAREPFFREAFRLLSDKGAFVLPVTTGAQLKHRFVNRFFPGLWAIERRRYPSVRTLRCELSSVGFRDISVEPLDLGTFRVDRAYVARQRAGIISGLLLLNAKQRREGLDALELAVRNWESSGAIPVVPWRRTLIVARKPYARRRAEAETIV